VTYGQSDENTEVCEERLDEQQKQIDALRREIEELKKLLGRGPASEEPAQDAEQVTPDLESNAALAPVTQTDGEKGPLSFSGRIHRVVMQVDDGVSSDGFFVDSDQGPTMLHADVISRSRSGWTVAGALEVGIQSNRSFQVSQENPNPGTDIQTRMAEIVLEREGVGKLSLGRGFAAAWVLPEVDLSGTVPAALLAVGNLAPGMRFVDTSTGELSAITVSQHFADTERLLLVDRFRFDSSAFGGGLRLSGSVAADSRWDAALRFYPTPGNWTVRATATYQHEPYRDFDDRIELGASARHEGTGLSLTAGFADSEGIDRREGRAYVLKGGWLTHLNRLGPTAFSIDFVSGKNAIQEGDRSESWGLFGVQKWNATGLDFYLGYREYEVERPDLDLEPLRVSVFGLLYEF
jgi:hypothetical protein